MFTETVPDDCSCGVEAPFAEFRSCPQHDQVTAPGTAETGLVGKIRHHYTDMLEKYTGSVPRTQMNVRNATLNSIH